MILRHAALASLVVMLGLSGSALGAPVGQTGDFATPTAASHPRGGMVAGPDGNLWFAEFGAAKIGEINPVTDAISEFSTPTAASGPLGITLGPDGNIWFTEWGAGRIGEINPTTHAISEFAIPTASSFPVAIAAGPDGNLWFTESGSAKIGVINPVSGAIAEFAAPGGSMSLPFGIAAGPDGNVWFTEKNAGKIGVINPTTHATTDFVLAPNSLPNAIAAGPNGSLWFTESAAASKLGLIDPATHAITEIPLAASSAPLVITPGPDGNLWFTQGGSNQIGEINAVTETVTEFSTPTAASGPVGIAVGADGNLWFTEDAVSKVGFIGAGAPAAAVSAPSVAGTAQPGSGLACQGATWSIWAGLQPSASAFGFDGYQWRRDGGPIGGATSPSYTPSAGDVGHQISCTVTVTYPLLQTTISDTSPAVVVSPPLAATLVGVSTSGTTASVTIACQGAPGQVCAGSAVLTSHVTTQSKKTIAVAASATKKRKRKQKKPKPAPKQTTVETVAGGAYVAAAGSSVTIDVALGSAGKRLLSEFYRLPTTMAIDGTTPISAPVTFSYGRIRSPVSFTWTFTTSYTIAHQLTISGLPSKARVTVLCHGRGCPFSRRVFSPHGSKLALASSLKHRHLHPQATLTVEITAANDVGKVVIFTTRSGNVPSLAERCLPPGVSRPTACA